MRLEQQDCYGIHARWTCIMMHPLLGGKTLSLQGPPACREILPKPLATVNARFHCLFCYSSQPAIYPVFFVGIGTADRYLHVRVRVRPRHSADWPPSPFHFARTLHLKSISLL